MSKGRRSKKNKSSNHLLVYLVLIIAIVGTIYLINKNKNDENKEVSNTNVVKEEIKSNKDEIKPEIKLIEDYGVATLGQEFKPKLKATDNIDGDISSKVQVSNLDINKAGEYNVTYSVKDSSGNETTINQKVYVREETSNGLPVLMYHFFYDGDKYKKKDNNWLSTSKFEEQLKYLTEQNYYFPTWDEVNDYIDGKTKLPSKSVVLTVDDGDDSFFDLAVPLLQKYKVTATIFVITDWYGYRYNGNLEYVSWQSHSQNMHESGANGKGRMVNWTYDQILADLNNSYACLGSQSIVFCYPFGHYNDTALKALEASPFKLAFTVEGGRVYKGSKKLLLPRVRVEDCNSMDYYKSSIK